ncbi:regulatory iron-sulfur-containing complex subunit RicT [Chitinophagaceae bacterium LB-8]|uniref:Regulatory iron-sulfur-containing complex subunit RicT n=1 Tax=Paraflavisolibacter caeni TaxID=2982496 RepID=A0A9X2XZ86_9BACT|nr:regulatory iron-sulfur-containing complex subunit RicT [Paraflavisolibacter caeni]MCU7551626.1 regulatory iron-sulfur-containing complex subunit RicT [Paraflavisolibacter caeni]
MGCGSCGTGKPGGCKSNGSCGTNSCNRMNAYDWLVNLPLSDMESACRVVELSFNNGSRKDFYRNSTLQFFEKGDLVTVEGMNGFDVGEIQLTGEIVRLQMKKKGVDEFNPDMKKVLRRAADRDLELWRQNKAREKDALIRSRAIARQLKLELKMSEVEIQADGKKGTFFYIADDRVDFRELIKIYASEFKLKVEMRQIGARQESAKVGGIGSCGRELCCATFLTDFKSVNTAAARYQNLSINQTKLSGQCGRLKCCLNYELDTYLDALQGFPENCDILQVTRGTATLIKKDIFKDLMWYVLPDSSKLYPLTIERVRKIKALNMQNTIPDELEAVELVSSKPKDAEPEFVDVVGHISLKSLEKSDKKRKQKSQGGFGGQQKPGQPQLQQKQLSGQAQQAKPAPQQPRAAGQQSQQRPAPQQQGGPQQKTGPQQKATPQQQKPMPQQQKTAPQQKGGFQQKQGGGQRPAPGAQQQGGGARQQQPRPQNRPGGQGNQAGKDNTQGGKE